MRERKILLVKLSGNWEDVTSLLGTYLIGQIKDAAFHRSVSDPPFYLYCDEFQKFSSRDFLTLFSESRGGNLHVTIDHQVVSQLDDTMKETVRQADAFFCFRITDISADQIGGMFDCSPRPGGVPRFEPLMTPVKEPIQYMLTHGVHPVDSVREFIDQYGNLLVEGERLEEEAARRSQSISDRLTYSTSTWHVMPPPPPAYPEFNCQIALHMLNSLFYQAMLYGKQGKDVRSIPIDPLAIDYFIIATYSPGTTYLFHRNAYRRAYPGVRNFAQRQQELTDNLAYLPGYRYSSLYPYYHKKRLAHRILSLREKRTRDFYEISSAITGAWRANQELQRAIARVDGIIQQKTEALEQELALLTQIAQAAPEYETSCQELTETIQTVMQELAKAPVQAASGLLQEIPTELPTPEVEARIANQLKLLPQFSARCRIGNTEYTITTPVPPSVLPAAELTQRIQRIQQHNVTDGYLRHRSEVEQELILPSASQLQGNGHTGVQQGIATPPLPQSRRKK